VSMTWQAPGRVEVSICQSIDGMIGLMCLSPPGVALCAALDPQVRQSNSGSRRRWHAPGLPTRGIVAAASPGDSGQWVASHTPQWRKTTASSALLARRVRRLASRSALGRDASPQRWELMVRARRVTRLAFPSAFEGHTPPRNRMFLARAHAGGAAPGFGRDASSGGLPQQGTSRRMSRRRSRRTRRLSCGVSPTGRGIKRRLRTYGLAPARRRRNWQRRRRRQRFSAGRRKMRRRLLLFRARAIAKNGGVGVALARRRRSRRRRVGLSALSRTPLAINHVTSRLRPQQVVQRRLRRASVNGLPQPLQGVPTLHLRLRRIRILFPAACESNHRGRSRRPPELRLGAENRRCGVPGDDFGCAHASSMSPPLNTASAWCFLIPMGRPQCFARRRPRPQTPRIFRENFHTARHSD